jgi:hypothetical protein
VATTEFLADPDELAAWLGVSADDARLRQALAAASRRFRGAVRHQVSLVADDHSVLDGGGREALLLPAAPVTAVTSVKLDGTLLAEGTDFAWSADGFLRRLGCCWPDRLRCVDVVYSHGYDPVPDDIAEVVIDQARAMYRVEPGIQTKTVGGQSVTFGVQSAIGVTAQWTDAVVRYRLNRGDRP